MTETTQGHPARYVALEHTQASGTHCDLMLERKGALLTWSIKAINTLLEHITTQGEQLPDHRIRYLDYEGPISGGRGHVRRLAQGSILQMHWSARQIRARLDGDLAGTLLAESDKGKFWQITLLKEQGHERNQRTAGPPAR